MHLGHFNEPLLVFGGAYSNLDALFALKKYASKHQIPAHNIICTGDIVAYCGQPYEAVELIREWGIHVLMGNCEESFATNANDCGCGFDSGTSCDLLSVEWYNFANQRLSSAQCQWFSELPRELSLSFLEKKIDIVHGSVTSINQFLFASSADHLFAEQACASKADIIVAGHSGIPFSKIINQKLWHNTGAIGMPANDGTPHTWFSVLSADAGCNAKSSIKIDSIALSYNHTQANKHMREAGLNNAYAAALTDGLWPSMDVLTEAEKLQQGIALVAHSIYYE
jgi:predicted phosphodiesterase